MNAMEGNKVLQTLNLGGRKYDVEPCWKQLGMTREYMATLLGRDEYTPVAPKQPVETDTIYTDPVSGNPAGFHAGQCVIYPDNEVEDGWGLSIAKHVETDLEGVPTRVLWYHATDVEKRVKRLEGLI